LLGIGVTVHGRAAAIAMTARARPAPGRLGALVHKGIAVIARSLSFDAGDLKSPEFSAINRAAARLSRSTAISRSPNRRRLSSIVRIVG
jgi:hypothetical protein